MIKADTSQALALARKLEAVRKTAVPYATRQTLNDNAFLARRLAITTIENEFTIRNKWTARRVNVERAKSLVIRDQQAATGSPEAYLERQEYGGLNRTPTPTPVAAGQPQGTRKRTRVVTKRNRTPNLKARKVAQGVPLVGRVRDALNHKERVVLVREGEGARPGVYRLKGGTAKRPERAQLQLVQAHNKRPTRTKPTHWLRRSALEAAKSGYTHYAKALQFQLDRIPK